MCIVNCALQQAVGLHRSVENDVPTHEHSVGMPPLGKSQGCIPTECEDSAGSSFSTERYIPNGM
ncbi:MAG: hypothetical protein LBQ66_01475 [Planctomycetaceae bacterium]|nr:hypothetical protein [Planctomycetaceae bacterium]